MKSLNKVVLCDLKIHVALPFEFSLCKMESLSQLYGKRTLSFFPHRAEFSDTSGTFSIACSANFEIARVKRRETIKKMAENGATLTASYLF